MLNNKYLVNLLISCNLYTCSCKWAGKIRQHFFPFLWQQQTSTTTLKLSFIYQRAKKNTSNQVKDLCHVSISYWKMFISISIVLHLAIDGSYNLSYSQNDIRATNEQVWEWKKIAPIYEMTNIVKIYQPLTILKYHTTHNVCFMWFSLKWNLFSSYKYFPIFFDEIPLPILVGVGIYATRTHIGQCHWNLEVSEHICSR